ncbi:hypothetical protein HDV05_008809 [Chytridiales sp. JEL 0842]|nr:hypothetical protein HDV05_008809 [Chytridiales sp. JEL 0842]
MPRSSSLPIKHLTTSLRSTRALATLSPHTPQPHPQEADVVIAGGGLIGISVAYHLVRQHREGLKRASAGVGGASAKPLRVVIVEKGDPLKLTSTASTGGFRNFYPQFSTMTALSNRSINWMRKLAAEYNNPFGMTEQGYTFLTSRKSQMLTYAEQAEAASINGSGDVRFHASGKNFDAAAYKGYKDGIDLIDDPDVIRSLVPNVTNEAVAMMHVRKAGYLHVEKLGDLLLQLAMKEGNVSITRGVVDGVEYDNTGSGKQVKAVRVVDPATSSPTLLNTSAFVLANGPHLKQLSRKVGVELPVINELHARCAIQDPKEIIPLHGPFSIWSDDIQLPFTTAEETLILKAHEEDPSKKYNTLLQPFPVPGMAGAHARPLLPTEDGGVRQFYGIWTYDNSVILENEPVYPTHIDTLYPTVILRGLTRLYPALRAYLPTIAQIERSKTKSPIETFLACSPLSGTKQATGYYCKTSTNTPLIGPLTSTHPTPSSYNGLSPLPASTPGQRTQGLFVCGGVSGFGVMCSQAAGELSAFQVSEYLGLAQDPKHKGEMKVLGMQYEGEFDVMEWVNKVPRRGREQGVEGALRTANQL